MRLRPEDIERARRRYDHATALALEPYPTLAADEDITALVSLGRAALEALLEGGSPAIPYRALAYRLREIAERVGMPHAERLRRPIAECGGESSRYMARGWAQGGTTQEADAVTDRVCSAMVAACAALEAAS